MDMGWSIAQDTHYLCISFLLNACEEELFSSYYYVFIQTLFQYNESWKVPFSLSAQGQQSRKHVSQHCSPWTRRTRTTTYTPRHPGPVNMVILHQTLRIQKKSHSDFRTRFWVRKRDSGGKSTFLTLWELLPYNHSVSDNV